MKVSVIIPTFNRKQSVLVAIASVLEQTVSADEVIVVDDGSTDGTSDAIWDHYGSRVVVVKQENGGVSAARNRGIECARGEWVAFLDSDDVWVPTKLERQIEALSTFGGEFGVCFTNVTIQGDPSINVSAFELVGLDCHHKYVLVDDPAKYVLSKLNPIGIQSLLVRRSLVMGPSGFDNHMLVAEDTDLVFRLALKTGFCAVTEPLVIIDRTPSRSCLSRAFDRKDDSGYACLEHMYRKWLDLSDLQDNRLRALINNLRKELAYALAIRSLRDLRLQDTMRKLGALRAGGESSLAVLTTLLSRGVKKMVRGAQEKKRPDTIATL